MAAVFTKAALQEFNANSVENLTRAQSGDILFCSGDYRLSQMIQAVSKSPWSHVGLLLQVGGKWLVLESVEDQGVHLLSMDSYLQTYHGLMFLGRSAAYHEAVAAPAWAWAFDQLGTPYNAEELAEIAARITLGIPRHHLQDKGYICSEFVTEVYERLGYQFQGQKAPGFVLPCDVWADALVAPLGRLK